MKLDDVGFTEFDRFLMSTFGVGALWFSFALTAGSSTGQKGLPGPKGLADIIKKRQPTLGAPPPLLLHYCFSLLLLIYVSVLICVTERPSNTGLPGESTFHIPSLEKDPELQTQLREFTRKLVTGTEKVVDPSKRHPVLLQLSTQALALLASTEITNRAIGQTLTFIKGASDLSRAQVQEGITGVVNQLVGVLFAHNGSIFQADLFDNTRGPTLKTALKGMKSRHTRTLAIKKEADSLRTDSLRIDLASASQSSSHGPKSYAEKHLANTGDIGERLAAGSKKRRKTNNSTQADAIASTQQDGERRGVGVEEEMNCPICHKWIRVLNIEAHRKACAVAQDECNDAAQDECNDAAQAVPPGQPDPIRQEQLTSPAAHTVAAAQPAAQPAPTTDPDQNTVVVLASSTPLALDSAGGHTSVAVTKRGRPAQSSGTPPKRPKAATPSPSPPSPPPGSPPREETQTHSGKKAGRGRPTTVARSRLSRAAKSKPTSGSEKPKSSSTRNVRDSFRHALTASRAAERAGLQPKQPKKRAAVRLGTRPKRTAKSTTGGPRGRQTASPSRVLAEQRANIVTFDEDILAAEGGAGDQEVENIITSASKWHRTHIARLSTALALRIGEMQRLEEAVEDGDEG